jgi:hypothetical protein
MTIARLSLLQSYRLSSVFREGEDADLTRRYVIFTMSSSDVIRDLLTLGSVGGGIRTAETPRLEAPRSGSIETAELEVFPVHGTSPDELYRRLRDLDYEVSSGLERAALLTDESVTLHVHERLA